MNSPHDRTVTITAWVHSCRLHGNHVALYGTDCTTTAEANGDNLYEECYYSGADTGPKHVYHVNAAALANLLTNSSNTNTEKHQ